MPSLRTRQSYDRRVLQTAQAALTEAASAVAAATDTLTEVQAGTFDLDALTVNGVRFEESGGLLVAVP